MKTLADRLDGIAVGDTFDSKALYAARQHPAVTNDDKTVLLRLEYGNPDHSDNIRLQEIAGYIREWDQA